MREGAWHFSGGPLNFFLRSRTTKAPQQFNYKTDVPALFRFDVLALFQIVHGTFYFAGVICSGPAKPGNASLPGPSLIAPSI